MQAHLGFIDVESKLNQGTTFRLYFPVPAASIEQIDTQEQKDSFHLEGTEKILLVEDEDFLRNMLRLTLESKGYKVYTASDGIAAIEIYKSHKLEIDLVITDFGLPGMTGMDEFKKLTALNPEIKVVITSGFLDRDVKNKLLMDGAKAILLKPYQPENILRTIREVLDKKSS